MTGKSALPPKVTSKNNLKIVKISFSTTPLHTGFPNKFSNKTLYQDFFCRKWPIFFVKICIVLAENICVSTLVAVVGILITVITKRCRSQELAKDFLIAIVCLKLCAKAIRHVIVTSPWLSNYSARSAMKISVADKRQWIKNSWAAAGWQKIYGLCQEIKGC